MNDFIKYIIDNLLNKLPGRLKSIFSGLSGILFVLMLGFVGLILWQNHTYNQLEKRTQIIKDLHELSEAGIDQNPELEGLYLDTIEDVEKERVWSSRGLFPSVNWGADRPKFGEFDYWIAFLTGGALGLIVFISYIFQQKFRESLSGVAYCFLVGIVSTLVPIVFTPWFSPLVVNIIIIYLIVKYAGTNNKPAKSEELAS